MTTTQTASPNTHSSFNERPRQDARHTGARESTTLTVRARTTCTGAHVHVGSLKLRHEDVSEFAARYQERPAISTLARLTSSAVNDIKGVLAPRMGLRVHAVAATALADDEPECGVSAINLALEIESPDIGVAIERLVRTWQEEFACEALPPGATVDVSYRVLDWYAG